MSVYQPVQLAPGLSIGNPIPQSRDRCFLGSSPRRLEPTFLNGNPGFRNAFLSCLGSLRVPKAGGSPLGKRPRRAGRSRVTRSRHKRPPPPSTLRSRGPLHLFRFAAPALLTARLGSPWSRASIQARFRKKLWGMNFFSTRS